MSHSLIPQLVNTTEIVTNSFCVLVSWFLVYVGNRCFEVKIEESEINNLYKT